jgi:hypothetical protein
MTLTSPFKISYPILYISSRLAYLYIAAPSDGVSNAEKKLALFHSTHQWPIAAMNLPHFANLATLAGGASHWGNEKSRNSTHQCIKLIDEFVITVVR